ncbi:hypothetical protein DP107_14320 [Haloglomus irregulare]|jgi:hypothetical protein|uniref:Uncharacterized protein n=1 Tax=Haloglomus irregulare TaxID=2234134 RepID=A0A554MXH5_9EURY|nr:hypothetical protein [Haloglomus irregulare]TSD09824.1 hypothetical protein DP107_14320 [Haloglomus irregulare]
MTDDRGQAHTLEGVIAAILLLSSLTFALQVTAVTPLSASTSSQHIENQQQSVAEGALTVTAENDDLKDAVLYWNESGENFHDATRGFYVSGPPPNEFGETLSMAYSGRGIAYNVYVSYQTTTGSWVDQSMLYRGRPSDNAISASRTVTIYDDDCLVDADNTTDTGSCLDDPSVADSFYANDVSDSGVFNVVRVEVVVWRM